MLLDFEEAGKTLRDTLGGEYLTLGDDVGDTSVYVSDVGHNQSGNPPLATSPPHNAASHLLFRPHFHSLPERTQPQPNPSQASP